MAYRLVYRFSIQWLAPGLDNMAPGGPNAQNLTLINAVNGQSIAGSGTGGALAAADITTLTNAAAADMSAQLNSNIAIPQGWISGLG
jgi:hypothetical protein